MGTAHHQYNQSPMAGKAEQQKNKTIKFQTMYLSTPDAHKYVESLENRAKTILVRVYHEKDPVNFRELYAILDEQSNRSLAISEFFDTFDEYGSTVEYTLRSCAGYITTSGRQASGYIVEALDGSTKLKLPTLIECNNVPNNRDEIATPEVEVGHPHLVNIAKDIPPLN